MRAEVEDFDVLENRARQNKQFYGRTLRRLRVKVNNYEALLHSEPYEDARPDDKLMWYKKLNKIVKDDCGLDRLEKLREENKRRQMIHAKESYNLLDEPQETTAPAAGSSPAAAAPPPSASNTDGKGGASGVVKGVKSPQATDSSPSKAVSPSGNSAGSATKGVKDEASKKQKQKKKQKGSGSKQSAKDKSMDWISQMGFGSKPEFQTIRVVSNYKGGPRQLRRLGPRGEMPVELQGLPPWLGPGAYAKENADKIIYDRNEKHYMVPFQSMSRDVVTIDDVHERLRKRNEWHAVVRERRKRMMRATATGEEEAGSPESNGKVLTSVDSFHSTASKRRHRYAVMLPSGSLDNREVREQLMKSFEKPNKLGFGKILDEAVNFDDISPSTLGVDRATMQHLTRKDKLNRSSSFDPEFGDGDAVKPSDVLKTEAQSVDDRSHDGSHSFLANQSNDDASLFGNESDMSVSTNNNISQASYSTHSRTGAVYKDRRAVASSGFMSKGPSKRAPKQPRPIEDYTKGGLDNLSTSVIETLSYSKLPFDDEFDLYSIGSASHAKAANKPGSGKDKQNPNAKNQSASSNPGSNKTKPYKPSSQSLSALSSSSKKSKADKPRKLEPLRPSSLLIQHSHSVSSLPINTNTSITSDVLPFVDAFRASSDGFDGSSLGTWEFGDEPSLSLGVGNSEEADIIMHQDSADMGGSLSLSLQTSSQISQTGSMASSEILYQNLYDECVRACRSTTASQQMSPLERRVALQSRQSKSRQQSPSKQRTGSPSRTIGGRPDIDSRSVDSSESGGDHVGSINLSGLLLPGEGVNVDGLAATYEPPPKTPDLTDKHRETNDH